MITSLNASVKDLCGCMYLFLCLYLLNWDLGVGLGLSFGPNSLTWELDRDLECCIQKVCLAFFLVSFFNSPPTFSKSIRDF